MATSRAVGTLALLGGGEWRDGCRDLDRELLDQAGAKEVVVVPTAAAYEHPDKVTERAVTYFEGLGVKVKPLKVVHRAEADDAKVIETARKAKAIYLADGSPLHLRSVLKGSELWDAMLVSYHSGGVLAASGAGATLVCDPMVDPRGGAYTVGLGVVTNLAVFPYHGSAAAHLRDRSIDLLPSTAKLVGIDEETALVRNPKGRWKVAGVGIVTVYDGHDSTDHRAGTTIDGLP
jgi:cyanophycinase